MSATLCKELAAMKGTVSANKTMSRSGEPRACFFSSSVRTSNAPVRYSPAESTNMHAIVTVAELEMPDRVSPSRTTWVRD